MKISDDLILEHGRRFASKYKHSWDGHFGHSYEFHPHSLIEFVKSLLNYPVVPKKISDLDIDYRYTLGWNDCVEAMLKPKKELNND